MVTLAMLCAAAAAWLLLAPPESAQRLQRALPTKPTSTPVATLVHRADAVRRAFLDKRRAPARWRAASIELCEGMAAELTAGRTPEEAFTTTAAVLSPSIARSLRAPPPHHDAINHLDHLAATQPGAESLRLLAATWRLGAERGGTLATVLDGLAAALRDEEAQRQEVAVHLAAPRATARLLAVLPVLGLAMATALGTNPLPFLVTTPPGLACLTTALALDTLGLWWTTHLANSAH
ncbi:type II secretion system F family protein [Actinomadura rupiterrae]|uniref:type II secretion system F family protein n=1 Tax=Actinomadura rupiterrae TaxID=559627 RepID=UPI00264680BA|nr:type II secretion system F family protein [Actinomadura rupiterrae]MCP2340364.1 tight adherence protein B [Actinomadura rupiterrae]